LDRNVLTATVLIALIMVGWLTWLAPQNEPLPQNQVVVDSLGVQDIEEQIEQAPPVVGSIPVLAADDSVFVGSQDVAVEHIQVETDLYTATFSNKGGTLVSLVLKEYYKFESEDAVQMVDTTKGGAIALMFTSPGNRNYDTRSFFFTPDARGDKVDATDAARTLSYTAAVGGGSIELEYSFTPGSYEVGLKIKQVGASQFATSDGYELVWNGGVPFTEGNRENEAQRSGTFARSGGSVESVTLMSDPYAEQSLNGQVDWVSVKNKYFTAVVIADNPTKGAELIGERFGEVSESYLRHDYQASLILPAAGAEADTFRMYIGPMVYKNLAAYNLDLYNMVDYGWDFFEIVTRPLAKFVFIPAFTYLKMVIPSYGMVIIVLAFLLKLCLYPLTKSSFKSMAKMRELQPRMEAIKEKYGDNPQKQQQATMKMYKETGVNPLGGCLPMLLQYPIIIALWQFLPQAIELRQQGFLWATDLSAPDILFHLPFDIPFYGNYVAGFTMLMGLSMVAQMKVSMTNQNNAQAKIFTYVFPVMIFVIFNKLASGLNLYYLCYNVLTAIQQKLINKQIHEHPEEMQKKDSKAAKKADPKRGSVTGKKAGGKKRQ